MSKPPRSIRNILVEGALASILYPSVCVFALVGLPPPGGKTPPWLNSALNGLIYVMLAIPIIYLASAFFTYRLQKKKGQESAADAIAVWPRKMLGLHFIALIIWYSIAKTFS